MTNVDRRKRVAKGVRAAGQFAAEVKSEPETRLAGLDGLSGRERADALAVANHPAQLVSEILEALPEESRDAQTVDWIARKGHGAANVKEYGISVCKTITAADLEDTSLTPEQVRSLHEGAKAASLGELEMLAAAGFADGDEVKDMARVMKTASVDELAAARRQATPAQMKEFSPLNSRKMMDAADAAAVRFLIEEGVDAGELQGYTQAFAERDDHSPDRTGSRLPAIAKIVQAGISPEWFRSMTRAGIPTDRATEFAGVEDPWAAGEPFREEWTREKARLVTAGWARVADWPWTREDCGTA